MAEALIHKRCFNHGDREAAARCPSCERFYCRECVTEHEGKVLCVRCLADQEAPEDATKKEFVAPGILLQAVCAIVVLWLIFTGLGAGLMNLPDDFHEGPRPYQPVVAE
jgi:hypothetical protein